MAWCAGAREGPLGFFVAGSTSSEAHTSHPVSCAHRFWVQVAIPGGLAGSAYAQSSADRFILWERRGESVVGTGLTVEQVFAKLSALRQELTGEVQVDQVSAVSE